MTGCLLADLSATLQGKNNAVTHTKKTHQMNGGNGVLITCGLHALHSWHHCPEVHKAIDGVRFIADHTKREEESTRVSTIL